MTEVRNWEQVYREASAPWDTGRPSPELQRVLREAALAPGRALELGCGTGANAIYLAQQGWEVTAIDACDVAIEKARHRGEQSGCDVAFLQRDVTAFQPDEPFDFIFDRGCYHCVRLTNLEGYLDMLKRCTQRGSAMHLICGNADEPLDDGPPTVSRANMCNEVGTLFDVVWLQAFRLDTVGRTQAPLAWSSLLRRRL